MQVKVKVHNGKFYVFSVMAESWAGYEDIPPNTLSISEADGVFDTREEAHNFAHKLDEEDEWFGSEYGVIDEVLAKDGANVTILDKEI
jgi:hypothetical protein